VELGDPTVSKFGNTSAGYPAGTQTYTGVLLSGTGYSVQLWAGPVDSTFEQLTLVPESLKSFRTNGFAHGFINNLGTNAVIPGILRTISAALQLRVWDNQAGTITTWEQAAIRGASLIFTSQPLGGEKIPPPNMVGLESFNLVLVPEPSTYALVGLGATVFWMFRQRK
jgi:hypothetical protein